MTEKIDLDRLNSLIPVDLGESPGPSREAEGLKILESVFPEVIQSRGRPEKTNWSQVIEDLNLLKKESNFKSQRKVIEEQAWRCTHTFAHQNNRVCNVVNGTYRNQKIVRKTCSKCCSPRTNPKSVAEELIDRLIQNLVDNGKTLEEARAEILGEVKEGEVSP